jgi:hypothetical protein
MENKPLYVEKKTMSITYRAFLLLMIVGSSTAMIVVLLLEHNSKSNFRHPL